MKVYKRSVEDLSPSELRKIVRHVRQICWPKNDLGQDWSPDHIEAVAQTLVQYGLEPTDEAYGKAVYE